MNITTSRTKKSETDDFINIPLPIKMICSLYLLIKNGISTIGPYEHYQHHFSIGSKTA